MFSPDGKKLVFASNRNAAQQGDTNVFIADWVEYSSFLASGLYFLRDCFVYVASKYYEKAII